MSTRTFPVVIEYSRCQSERSQQWLTTVIVNQNVPSSDWLLSLTSRTFPAVIKYRRCQSERSQQWLTTVIVNQNVPSSDWLLSLSTRTFPIVTDYCQSERFLLPSRGRLVIARANVPSTKKLLSLSVTNFPVMFNITSGYLLRSFSMKTFQVVIYCRNSIWHLRVVQSSTVRSALLRLCKSQSVNLLTRTEQLTQCFEPLQKLRARLGSRKTGLSPPPSILILTVPRGYFCYSFLLLLVLVCLPIMWVTFLVKFS